MSDLAELNTQQSIGRLEGSVEALKSQVSSMDAKLTAVISYIDQQKGSAKAAKIIASILGAVFGASASAAVEYLRTKHGG